MVAVAEDPEGVDARRAQHLHQTDGQQQRGGAEQQVVRRERPVEHVHRLVSRTSASQPSTGLRCSPAVVVTQCPPRRPAGSEGLSARGDGGPTPRRRPRGRRSSRTCPWRRTLAPAAPCRRARPASAAAPTTRSMTEVSPSSTSITGTSGACRESASAMTARSRPRSTTPRSRDRTACTRPSKVAPLASPPGHPHDGVVGLQRRGGRVRVGGLGVVDVAHLVDLSEVGDAVTVGHERAQPLAHGRPWARRSSGPGRRPRARWRRSAAPARPGRRRCTAPRRCARAPRRRRGRPARPRRRRPCRRPGCRG